MDPVLKTDNCYAQTPPTATLTTTATTLDSNVSAAGMQTVEQFLSLATGHMPNANYMINNNQTQGVKTMGCVNISIGAAPGSPPANGSVNLGPGLTLMQSSPPPASYRHSRAYRHFKNPPQPHMCIRTTTETGEEIFINVLSWTRIVIPQEPSDPIPLYGGMRVPPGSPRSPPIVFAVMANPEVLKDAGRHSKDADERRAMVELMCDFVEAMNPGVKLVRNAVILKDRDISGELKDVWNAVQAQRDREREEQLIQQRQQQQYITTQQMFPKLQTANTSATNTATDVTVPTPTPLLIGGRCGSLVGSSRDIASTQNTQNTTPEESVLNARYHETSVGEESATANCMAAMLARPENTVASGNSTTKAATTDITDKTTTTAAVVTTIPSTTTIFRDEKYLVAMNDQTQRNESQTDLEVNKMELFASAVAADDKDYVDGVKNIIENVHKIESTFIESIDSNKASITRAAEKLQTSTATILCLENQKPLDINIINNETILVPTTTNAKHDNDKIIIPTTTTAAATAGPTATINNTNKEGKFVNGIITSTIKTNEIQTAINGLKIRTTIPTATATAITKINNTKSAQKQQLNIRTTTTTTTTTSSTTATTTMPTKREKLVGFLPNGCIFPRFKNNKNKDKEKDKEKEVKCKDKEKTLLHVLKKSKDKKVTTMQQQEKCKSASNSQDRVATSTQTQQQQQQTQYLYQEQSNKTQYEKNCINLEHEMQKLDINKIDGTNNSEKNMFIKLKCAATSAVAK